MRPLIAVSCLILQALSPAPGPKAHVPAPPSAPVALWRVSGEGHGRPANDLATVYFLSRHHEVLAVNAESGVMRWRQSTSEPGGSTEGSTVTIAGSVVVAGDYNLVAFDRATGAFRWRFVPALGYAPGIYLGGASRGLVFAGSPAGRLYAVSSSSGELAWSVVVTTDGHTTVFPPVTDGSVVAAGYTTFTAPNVGGVVLLDAATGHERWRAAFPRAPDPLLGTGSAGGPILVGDLVIAASGDGTIYGLDRGNGSIRWTLAPILGLPPILQGPSPAPTESAGADYRPLARSGRLLFAGSLKGHVIAYDLVTRREAWRYVDDRSGSVSFAIVSDEHAVYVPYFSGRHVALNVETGTERWRTTDARDGFSWPAVSLDNRVYLAGGRGGFVAFLR